MSNEKRLIIAVVLSALVMLGANYLGVFKQPDVITKTKNIEVSDQADSGTKAGVDQKGQDGSDVSAADSAAPQAAPSAASVVSADVADNDVLAKVLDVQTQTMKLAFSGRGGGLDSVVLKHFGLDRENGENLIKYKEPIFNPLSISRFGTDASAWKRNYAMEEHDGSVIMTAQIAPGIFVDKQFVLKDAEKYLIDLTVTVRNTSGKAFDVAGGYDISGGYLLKLESSRRVANNVYLLDEDGELTCKTPKKVGKSPLDSGRYIWAGVKNRYYSMILRPKDIFKATKSAVIDAGKDKTGVAVLVTVPEFSVPTGSSVSQKFSYYAGPNKYNLLADAGYRFTDILDFGWFSPVCILLLKMLLFFYGIFKNYGVAIIVLTFVIKVVLSPLTHGSMKSMQKMQAVQPQVAALKEKFKDDPKRMQAEMMRIYKENGINPLGGCLPMLLQLPIFIAFYSTLQSSIELQGAHFLWIKDLASPDTVATIGAVPINILPLIMGATTLLQQKLSTPGGAANSQQQTMMKLMPLIFTFMFYSFPAGLVLYWLMNNVFTILQQLVTNRFGKKA